MVLRSPNVSLGVNADVVMGRGAALLPLGGSRTVRSQAGFRVAGRPKLADGILLDNAADRPLSGPGPEGVGMARTLRDRNTPAPRGVQDSDAANPLSKQYFAGPS